MALSKPGSEAEILARLLESQQEMALNIKHLTDCLYKMSEKVACAEMRQCQTTGEGTDAARMLGLYLRGHSAQWTKHTKEVILESVYENGNFDAVEYSGIFHKKDVRRGELAVACFYLTAIEKVKMVINPFLETEEQCKELFRKMPSFRRELREAAAAKDATLGTEKVKKLERSYTQAIEDALGEQPSDLQALFDLCLPINKKWKPIEPREDDTYVSVGKLGPRIEEWFKWAEDNLSFEREGRERKWATEVVCCWCCAMEEISRRYNKVQLAEYHAELAKYQEDGDDEVDETNLNFNLRKITKCHPFYSEILAKHTALEKQQAEDLEKTRAAASDKKRNAAQLETAPDEKTAATEDTSPKHSKASASSE